MTWIFMTHSFGWLVYLLLGFLGLGLGLGRLSTLLNVPFRCRLDGCIARGPSAVRGDKVVVFLRHGFYLVSACLIVKEKIVIISRKDFLTILCRLLVFPAPC
jgi:hypothetical protein